MTKRQLILEYLRGIFGEVDDFDHNAWIQKCWDNGYDPDELEAQGLWESTQF